MYNYWYGITDKDLTDAQETIDFLENKKQKIYDLIKENLTDEVKEKENDKLKRINISLNSIKYYYSLNTKIKSETTQN